MIDRGALILALADDRRYRGLHRKPFDALTFTGRRGRELGQRYAAAIVAGEGVVEDLDEALALRAAAEKIGIHDLDVIVFEVPQEPKPAPRALPIAPAPPADGLEFMGYDVVEAIEPYFSPLATPDERTGSNAHGLIATREDAEVFAESLNATAREDPFVAVRVWLAHPPRT